MRTRKLLQVIAAFFAAGSLAGCTFSGSFRSNPGGVPPTQANIAIIGQDASLASVVSFHVTLLGLTATDGTNTVTLTTGSQDIEFARLTGLRTLLDLHAVQAGTFTSITAMLVNPVISVLDVTTTPPSIQTISGTLTTSSVTLQLPAPLSVANGDLIALLFDFNLAKSLNSTGTVDGTVVPTLSLKVIPADAPEAHIDELTAGVSSVDAANNSFGIQLRNGLALTVVIDANTDFEPSTATLSSLDTNTIVEVSGQLDRATRTLHADEVDVVSQDRFFAGGLLTDVRPPTGPATQIDLFIRSELPDLTTMPPGTIGTFNLTGNEIYLIRRLRTPLSLFIFNNSAMVRGQRVALGGMLNASPLVVHRVTLYPQGFDGAWVPGSTMIQSGNQGAFQFIANGLLGVLFNGPVTVLTSDFTRFAGGLNGLGDLSGTQAIKLRIVGLVLKDTSSGSPVVVARRVEQLP